MSATTNHPERTALRGSILHFIDDPTDAGNAASYEFFEDGLLIIEDGYINKVGNWRELEPGLSGPTNLIDHTGKLILPGFIDTHIHYVQSDIIGSHGRRLLDWLEEYTFPAERAFADSAHAAEVAAFFVRELLRNGTTTALVLGSVHPQSADAIFAAAGSAGMRLAAGKVLMDRNCPEYLQDTAEIGYETSKALIERWHNRDRLLYAVTPRFAPTSTPEQLERAGHLVDEYPDVYMHTHVAENEEEVVWVRKLYPDRRSYLDVYDHYGLLTDRSILAHGIWLEDEDLRRMAERGAAVSHCPTANLFMGSGLLDLEKTEAAGVTVALGTDVGGGTTFSMLRVMHEAYKVAQLRHRSLSPLRAFYLATLAGARAMGLDHCIGSFASGNEADFIVMDPGATPLLKRRMESTETLEERLFVLMMLGDERTIAETFVMGKRFTEGGRR